MKHRYPSVLPLAVFAIGMSATISWGSGSLIPPAEALSGGIPVAFMKSLDQVEPRQMIAMLPYAIVIPGSYYLSQNLVGTTSVAGITIACSDVHLDLSGFSINGVGASLTGIHVITPNTENITIRNGIVRGWGLFGINATNARDTVISHIKASHNRWGGIYAGENATIEQCATYGNGLFADVTSPPSDGGIFAWKFGMILNCVSRNNKGAGIFVQDHGKVLGCTATESPLADGIRASSYCTIRDCVSARNRGHGIRVESMSRIIDNTCGENGRSPILWTNSAGIAAEGGNNIIEKNIVAGNYNGIKTTAPGNLVIHNAASFNIIPFSFTDPTFRGPTLQPTGVITNTNPWLNFQIP